MLKRDNLFQRKETPQDNERNKQLILAEKTCNLKLCASSLKAWPQPVKIQPEFLFNISLDVSANESENY